MSTLRSIFTVNCILLRKVVSPKMFKIKIKLWQTTLFTVSTHQRQNLIAVPGIKQASKSLID